MNLLAVANTVNPVDAVTGIIFLLLVALTVAGILRGYVCLVALLPMYILQISLAAISLTVLGWLSQSPQHIIELQNALLMAYNFLKNIYGTGLWIWNHIHH
ncbi:MAG: hypothetical protein WBB28_01660 [Crinalium sp.]